MLSYIYISHEFIEPDVIIDSVNEYNLCIDNKCTTESFYTIDNNNNNSCLSIKDIFRDFINTFSNKNKQLNYSFHYKSNSLDIPDSSNNTISSSTILNELKIGRKHNLQEKEIQTLKEEVSILKIELLRCNINKLDLIRDLDRIIKSAEK